VSARRRDQAPRAQNRKDAMAHPLQFLQQVRSEVAKIHWPERREVLLTTLMVFILAALTSAFFAVTDIAIRWGIETIIGS